MLYSLILQLYFININDEIEYDIINKRLLSYLNYLWNNSLNKVYKYRLENFFVNNIVNNKENEKFVFYTDGALNMKTLVEGIGWIQL